MSDDVVVLVEKLEERIGAKDPTALEDAIKLTEKFPEEAMAWSTLAYAHSRQKNYAAASVAETKAIELEPEEPVFLANRAYHDLRLGNWERVIADASRGLEIGAKHNMHYYRASFHGLRAEAYIQLGRNAEARVDVDQLPENYVDWTIKLRRKADFVALCAE